ncbi:MAG: replication-associated recombination protein A [Pseudomonadota bacterium]
MTDFRPLADRMRPDSLETFVGQPHLVGPQKPLRRMIESGQPASMILWGPPGTGKTTLARMVAASTDMAFFPLSAVMSGVKEVRAAMAEAQRIRSEEGRGTLLFLDEVHRFNKSQQDAFLPFIEDGTIVFVGATTENPAFELNNALLSRARVFVLKSLSGEDLGGLVERTLQRLQDEGQAAVALTDAQRLTLVGTADGDARRLLGLLEAATQLGDDAGVIHDADFESLVSGTMQRFDKGGDAFYDQISALHKAVRGSDPDAALYWMQRMLIGGCDPLYVARRLVRMASEDIGNADPRGLTIALDAWHSLERLGSPEGELMLGQAVVFLACAAKSNAVYNAFKAARHDAEADGSLEVPAHLRNAPTKLAKSLGHSEGYRYAHDEPDAFAAGVNYFPEAKRPRKYYHPSPRGLEIQISDKLERLERQNANANPPLRKR